MSNKTKENNIVEYNVFRHSLLRYAGYANEIGESFRYQFPRFVTPSYIVAFGYCFADSFMTGWSTWNNPKQGNEHERSIWNDTVRATADTLLWQTLASVMIPGATINLIVKASRLAIRKSPLALPVFVSKWSPTVVGISSIPVIVHPIDDAVDVLLDNSTRQWWPKE
jgi:fission process protein 1